MLDLRSGRMQGSAEERGTLCLGNTHPHANMFPFDEMCPGPREGKFPGSTGMHRGPPLPLVGNLGCLWKVRASRENVLHLTVPWGRNMLFRGGWGAGSRGPVISLLLPRYHPA